MCYVLINFFSWGSWLCDCTSWIFFFFTPTKDNTVKPHNKNKCRLLQLYSFVSLAWTQSETINSQVMGYVCGCCSHQLHWITQIFMSMLSFNLLAGNRCFLSYLVFVDRDAACIRSSLRNHGLRLFTTCFLFPCCHLAAAAMLTASISFILFFSVLSQTLSTAIVTQNFGVLRCFRHIIC